MKAPGSKHGRFAPSITRRQTLTATGAAATAVLVAPAGLSTAQQVSSNTSDMAHKSLGALAVKKGLVFGASFAVHELDRDYGSRYAEIYAADTKLITSELCLKLGILRPNAHILNFEPADRFFAFAKTHNLAVHGHTLIWDDYVPDWIKALSKDEVEHLLDAHIMTVLERYQGRAQTWDVVNEPIAPWDKNPGNLRQGPFYGNLGEEYISRAFKRARDFAPQATLLLNEAQTESSDENGKVFRDSLMALLKRQIDLGAPIDGVGLQCHLKSNRPYDFAHFAAFIQSLVDLGLDVKITELDIDDRAFASDIKTRDAQVASMYRQFLTHVLAVPEVSSLAVWQLSDRTSWMADPNIKGELRTDGRPSRPLPYDLAFEKKPAWHAIAEAFDSMPQRRQVQRRQVQRG